MAKKKILVVSQHFWPESFRINDITDFFIEKGCDVDVLCGLPNYPTGFFFKGYSYFRRRKESHNNVSIKRVFEIPRGNNTNIRIFLNYISFPIASLFHIPLLLTKKYNKIFLFQTSPVMMSFVGIIIGKIKKTETTMYVLDLWPENLYSVININNPFFKKLITKISHWHYRHVDKLVVLSSTMKDHLTKITKIPKEKIIIIPQACEKIYEVEKFDKKISNKFKHSFNILYTGNISPAQSFNTIIQAAKNLKNDGINNINWIIVGDGMSRNWLKNEVKKANLNNIFYFEGQKPINDIPKYTAIADILIGCLVKSNLLEATIPAKVMSYLAAGKPIVLAMDGEVQKLINNKIKCGLVGPTEDSLVMAKNIKTIYNLSLEKRKIMGTRAKNYHLKHFERNILLNRLFDFIFS